MKRLKDWWFVLLLTISAAVISLLSFSYRSPILSARPNVVMETLDPSLEQYEAMWEREISRRFDNAVGILVHGGDFVEGQWIVGAHIRRDKHVTPIQKIIADVKEKHPGRTIVVLACNPGHLKLGIPGVYYAHSSVWCIPDRELRPEMFQAAEARRTLGSIVIIPTGFRTLHQPTRWEEMPDIVGNIFEFQAE
jgi:hypothetical protein